MKETVQFLSPFVILEFDHTNEFYVEVGTGFNQIKHSIHCRLMIRFHNSIVHW
jgi:hypothetical protein